MGSTDMQDISLNGMARAFLARLRGDGPAAVRFIEEALSTMPALGLGHANVRAAVTEGFDVAFAVGDLDLADRLLAVVEEAGPGAVSPSLQAHGLRARAKLEIAR